MSGVWFADVCAETKEQEKSQWSHKRYLLRKVWKENQVRGERGIQVKEYVCVSFTKELAEIRSLIFLRDRNGYAMRLDKDENEPITIMTSHGDKYYFIAEKDRRRFFKSKKWRIKEIS